MEKRMARGKRRHAGYDFSKSIENIKNRRFNFGSWNREAMPVDLELASLFECLSVECSNVLVHPQWKHFSHIEIVKNDQFRLSNGIWRSWHMQFQKGRVPRFCVFDINPHLEHHKNAASVVLEGKYWKRKVEAVAREYRKWRVYHRDQNRLITKREPWLYELLERAHGDELGDGVPQAMQVEPQRPTFIEDFPDAFFLNIQQDSPSGPLYTSTADVIPHPNLDMLNPMLEDLLDKFEPMEGMLSRSMGAVGSFFSATNSFNTPPPSLRPDMQPFSQQLPTPMQTSEQFAGSSDLSKPLTQTQPPFATQFSSLGGYTATRGMLAEQQYILSPSSFLTIPSEEPKGREPLIDPSMEIGAPQISNYAMKPEPSIDGGTDMSTCTHGQVSFDASIPTFQSQRQPLSTPTPTPTPTLTPTLTPTPPPPQRYATANGGGMVLQDGVCSMAADSSNIRDSQQQKDPPVASLLLGLFGPDSTVPQQQPPTPVQSPPLGSTPLTHMTSKRLGPQEVSQSQQGSGVFQFPQSVQPQQSPFKAPNFSQPQATNLSPLSSHSVIRVSSAGSLTAMPARPPLERGSSEPTQFLQEQVRKLSEQQEQQRREIEKQHSLADQQYKELMQQYLSQKPSEQQQQVLQSVLADPSLLNLLRNLLLSTALPTGAPLLGKLAISPQTTSKPLLAQQASPPGQAFALPTQLTKVNVSSFPGRLAAATNTNSNSANAATALATPVSPQIKSPFKEPDASISPKVFPFVPQRKLKSVRTLSVDEKEVYQELRRQSHISAEQKRRGNIKHGFDHLQSLVVNLSAYPSGKVSKATVLEKSIEYIQRVHQEREGREREIEALKKEMEELNTAIVRCQEQLPASGAPITRQRFEENRQRFKEYVQRRTLQNYKFWMFSIILQQLFESYNSMVSTGNSEELCHTVLAWFEQNCTLPSLRPVVMNSLRELSMKTSILSDPSQVPHQLAQYAKQDMQRERSHNLPRLT